ncbi:hypothetical protein [Butyrivibrio sp. NC3005]|uniref:hypothetical protein n=1 Tax=Butyrivibrio sp. NC3005 TaxID=1280685 RepID=UPI0004055FE4|nr:hypothetical protein [Butyrivibrio sp. NC3005]
MAVVEQLLRAEADGTLSFGNYMLPDKKKLEGFKHNGDLLKVKTFKDITRLESNDMFVYESVPGTAVTGFKETEKGVSFSVEGPNDAQITLGMEDNTEYNVLVNGLSEGRMKTGLGGKLSVSVEMSDKPVSVEIERC